MSDKQFGFTFDKQSEEGNVTSFNGQAVPPGTLYVPPPMSGDHERVVSEEAVAVVRAAYAFARAVQRDAGEE